MEKITLKQGFARAIEDYKRIGDADMVAFFEKRLEQASKKSTSERKPTAHQLENETIKQSILASMEQGHAYTITEMLTTFDCFPDGMSPNRLSALLTQLGAKGTNQIVREQIKGKAYFTLA